jgi:hypothetical protein
LLPQPDPLCQASNPKLPLADLGTAPILVASTAGNHDEDNNNEEEEEEGEETL